MSVNPMARLHEFDYNDHWRISVRLKAAVQQARLGALRALIDSAHRGELLDEKSSVSTLTMLVCHGG